MSFYFNRFEWNRGIIIYDTPAFESSVGTTGGYLLAATIHSYMISSGIDIFGWEILPQQSYEDMLRSTVGNNFASESCFDLWRSALKSLHSRYLLWYTARLSSMHEWSLYVWYWIIPKNLRWNLCLTVSIQNSAIFSTTNFCTLGTRIFPLK